MNNPTKAQPRLLSRLGALSLLTTALIFGTSAAPSAAMTPQGWFTSYSTASYVALGDSFSSGQGAPPYLAGDCLQSKYTSYPVITAALTRYKLVANESCSGADMAHVAQQLADVPADVKSSAKLVTLTVGGIDIGSNVVLAACGTDAGSAQCAAAIGQAMWLLTSPDSPLKANLTSTYEAIASAMPNARVVVFTYPYLFKDGVSPLGDQVNGALALLNGIIESAAAGIARVQVVDVTQEFANHGIGSRIPYISFNPNDLYATANFHPNALGNALGYFRAMVNDHALG